MALFDKLKDTHLKSYSFKMNEKPYIIQDINNPSSNTLTDRIEKDVTRVTKFLTDSSKGPLFITKQIGLQLSNPKLETKNLLPSDTFLGKLGNTINSELGSTRLYNAGINTLAQVAVGGFGEHVVRHGLTPIQNDNTKYESVVKHNNKNNSNRLVKLYNDIISTSKKSNFDSLPGLLLANTQKSREIYAYFGGPNSFYGVGRTKIYRADLPQNLADGIDESLKISNTKTSDISVPYVEKLTPISQLILKEGDKQDANDKAEGVVKTSVKTLSQIEIKPHKYYDKTSTTLDSVKYTFITGSRDVEYVRNQKDAEGLTSKADVNFTNGKLNQYERDEDDIMTILFELINPFTGNILKRLVFPAYMKGYNEMSSSPSQETNYVGRSESFLIGGKFKRTGSFNLSIPCFNPIQLHERHRSLGILNSSRAGMYSLDNKLGMILCRLYVGNYLKGETVYLEDVKFAIPDEVTWDVDEKLAHIVTADISFTILHNRLPTFNPDGGFMSHIQRNTSGLLTSKQGFLASGYDRDLTNIKFNEPQKI